MDRLWAPWRGGYIAKCVSSRKETRCILCVGRSKRDDKKRYILARSKYSFSILNTYPYNNGHIMIAPYRHVKELERLSGTEFADIISLLVETKKILDRRLKPHGYNIGINLGRVAGAGIDGHIHIHIVPRWSGDTNFMSIVSDTRVVSHSLVQAYKLLKGWH